DRAQGRIDDEQARALLLCGRGQFFDLALPEPGSRTNRPHAKRPRRDDIDADGLGEAFGFLDTGFGRAARAFARKLGHGNDRSLAARDVGLAMAVIVVQDSLSAAESSAPRFSG